MKWFLTRWNSFRAWLDANKSAHENAQPRGCCSSPPPGAGHPAEKGK